MGAVLAEAVPRPGDGCSEPVGDEREDGGGMGEDGGLGVVGEGELVLLVAFGAGFTWGSAVVRW